MENLGTSLQFTSSGQTIAIYLFPFYIIFTNHLSRLFLSVIYNYVRKVIFEINTELELTPPLINAVSGTQKFTAAFNGINTMF